MRAVIAFLMLSGCAGSGTGAGSTRPGVMPMLSELPGDPVKRDAVLDSAATTAGPEQRKGMTVQERKAETAASTAAAILGGMFSKTQNTTLGSAGSFDENAISPSPTLPPPLPLPTDTPANPPPAADDAQKDLVPWVKLPGAGSNRSE